MSATTKKYEHIFDGTGGMPLVDCKQFTPDQEECKAFIDKQIAFHKCSKRFTCKEYNPTKCIANKVKQFPQDF